MHILASSREHLYPEIAMYLNGLLPECDLLTALHREAGTQLATWIADNYVPGKPLLAVAVCTGNSRRSMLTAILGNSAAVYFGLNVRFASGGTLPSAFNPRTITALQEIGVVIEATGEEAPRGEPSTANPIYRVQWGEKQTSGLQSEVREFSKTYRDATVEATVAGDKFAALMVCDEADANCPIIPGAALRLAMPYSDPKAFDNSPKEADAYRQCRDAIGRLMLFVMARARKRLDEVTRP